jgi:hypothetical protein
MTIRTGQNPRRRGRIRGAPRALKAEMEFGLLSAQRVTFQGPPLTRRIRGALSAAAITMIEHRAKAGSHGQLQDYLVSVDARDSVDAVARVRAVVEKFGPYSAFAAARP